MGCGSRPGKMEQHNSGKPFVKQKKCIGCQACAKICAHGAPQFGADNKATIDTDKCVGCARCLAVCPWDAIQCLYDEAPSILNYKIAEYTKAVVDGRPCFHVSLVMDVSPNCDCHAGKRCPIVPNVGMFASFDPVALDQACVDAVLAQPKMPNSVIGSGEACQCEDHFKAAHPASPPSSVCWQSGDEWFSDDLRKLDDDNVVPQAARSLDYRNVGNDGNRQRQEH